MEEKTSANKQYQPKTRWELRQAIEEYSLSINPYINVV